ncbi:MAG: aldehyde dehydrogenase family protein [Planctomycetota bacterium]
MAKAEKMLIDGKWVAAQSGKTFPTLNPANGRKIADVAEGDKRDIDRAVKAARKAFDGGAWTRIDVIERERILRRIGDLILQHQKEIARLEAQDVGKPIRECEGDVQNGAAFFEFMAGVPSKLNGMAPPAPEGFFAYVTREPVGVIGQIIPWNFPFMLGCIKISLGLATGNALVVKPAEDTPLTTLILGRLCMEAGVPPGVVNIVTGFGPTAGAALSEHPDVDKISFTGSTEVGKLVMNVASRDLKRVSLELGGKGPNVVFADANLADAVRGSLFGIFLNSGQVCCAGSRLFLHKKIQNDFLAEFVAQAKNIRVGDPLSRATQMGPLVSKKQLERVCGYVEAGKKEGAKLLLGGDRPKTPALKNGCFLNPTVFDGVTNTMKIAREEIFGPVVSVIPFEDEGDVIRKANATTYGLASAIWTKDIKRAFRFAKTVRAGSVWVNTHHMFGPTTPWGGFKESGIGRENGLYAIEAYTELKTVWIHTGEAGINHYGT